MPIEYIGLSEINGPLVVLDHVENVGFEEMVTLRLENGGVRTGRVVALEGQRAVIQVFEGTAGLSLGNTRTRFLGRPMTLPLSKEMLGRVFSGSGAPIDGLGPVYGEKQADINGRPINPVSRTYPRNYIHTGISSIDALSTLIRGQKLPIFSGSGMNHNKLAVQLVRQSKVAGGDGEFAVVFGAMGVTTDVAGYFRRSFEEAGILKKVCMFQNLSNDPIIERILTPRCALTAAEYLAFEHHMHILVILTDMTSYAEALREFSSSKGEIPGRKGYPGYLYSDLASLYAVSYTHLAGIYPRRAGKEHPGVKRADRPGGAAAGGGGSRPGGFLLQEPGEAFLLLRGGKAPAPGLPAQAVRAGSKPAVLPHRVHPSKQGAGLSPVL